MRWEELDGRSVGIVGFGREGRAALSALRARARPDRIVVFDEAPVNAPGASVVEGPLDGAALAECEVLIRSPGVSPYRPAMQAALASGCRVCSGSSLWLAEPRSVPVVAVTGTKGKSTVTALIAHLLGALGWRTAVGGNIGVPLLDLDLTDVQACVVEFSSYQCVDLTGQVEVAVLNNLYPEHLDWHGSEDRYYRDKVRLLSLARHVALVNGACPRSVERTAGIGRRRLFNVEPSWRAEPGRVRCGAPPIEGSFEWTLRGRHNLDNLAAAVSAIAALGVDVLPSLPALAEFRGLEHRQRVIAEHGGVRFVDDSLATTPHATLAALHAFGDRPCAVIVGGHDRGLDWDAFARTLAAGPVELVVIRGANGRRIEAALATHAPTQRRCLCGSLEDSVGAALEALGSTGGNLLLSPGAPSFGEFRDYRERGARFAAIVGALRARRQSGSGA